MKHRNWMLKMKTWPGSNQCHDKAASRPIIWSNPASFDSGIYCYWYICLISHKSTKWKMSCYRRAFCWYNIEQCSSQGVQFNLSKPQRVNDAKLVLYNCICVSWNSDAGNVRQYLRSLSQTEDCLLAPSAWSHLVIFAISYGIQDYQSFYRSPHPAIIIKTSNIKP